MNEMQIFNNPKFGNVRTVEHDGEVWFSGNDVARALGYGDGNPNSKALAHAVQDHVSEDDKRLLKRSDFKVTNSEGFDSIGNYGAMFINESGMYSLIFGSKLESAKEFKRWVTHDVLPSIRKTGGYKLPQTTSGQIQLLAQGQVEISQRMDKVEEEISTMREELPLFPVELERVTSAVRRCGVAVLGGKESEAYHDRGLAMRVYRDIYGEIHRNFGVDTYKNLRRQDLPRVVGIIEAYTPPVVLADIIAERNAA